MKKIGVAVVGSGIYGEVHARTYSKHPAVELVSIWSRSTSRAKRVARKFDCKWTTDYTDLLRDDRIHVLSIATPDHAHTKYAITALNAGKHVLLEKPMAQTTKECRDILAARKRSGRKLMVNYHNRWYPDETLDVSIGQGAVQQRFDRADLPHRLIGIDSPNRLTHRL